MHLHAVYQAGAQQRADYHGAPFHQQLVHALFVQVPAHRTQIEKLSPRGHLDNLRPGRAQTGGPAGRGAFAAVYPDRRAPLQPQQPGPRRDAQIGIQTNHGGILAGPVADVQGGIVLL